MKQKNCRSNKNDGKDFKKVFPFFLNKKRKEKKNKTKKNTFYSIINERINEVNF